MSKRDSRVEVVTGQRLQGDFAGHGLRQSLRKLPARRPRLAVLGQIAAEPARMWSRRAAVGRLVLQRWCIVRRSEVVRIRLVGQGDAPPPETVYLRREHARSRRRRRASARTTDDRKRSAPHRHCSHSTGERQPCAFLLGGRARATPAQHAARPAVAAGRRHRRVRAGTGGDPAGMADALAGHRRRRRLRHDGKRTAGARRACAARPTSARSPRTACVQARPACASTSRRASSSTPPALM